MKGNVKVFTLVIRKQIAEYYLNELRQTNDIVA